MNKQQYCRILNKIREKPAVKRRFIRICLILPQLVMVVYAVSGLFLLLRLDLRFWSYTFVPLAGLLLSVVFRNLFKRRRPFEAFDIEPLFSHDNGKSFPSKHAASSAVIALACWYLNPWLGVFMVVLSFAVGITRVMAGLHYPSDVLAGWLLGAVVGFVGCFLI